MHQNVAGLILSQGTYPGHELDLVGPQGGRISRLWVRSLIGCMYRRQPINVSFTCLPLSPFLPLPFVLKSINISLNED